MKLDVIPENSRDDNKSEWFDDGLSFSCTQCGNCCTGGPGYVWVNEQEIERLAAHFSMSVQQVTEKYLRKLGSKYSLREFRNDAGQYDCEFLIEQKTRSSEGRLITRRVCGLYHVRPLQCRTWPFWDGLLESKQSWELAGKRCPGLNAGKRYSKEQILALRDASDWPERAGQASPGGGSGSGIVSGQISSVDER